MSRHTKRDDESGQFSGEVSEQNILKIFEKSDEPVLTASEVAEELPIKKDAVTYRLNKMHEKGLIGKKDAGARAVVWWSKVVSSPEPATEGGLEKYEGMLKTEKSAKELVEEAREKDREREERLLKMGKTDTDTDIDDE